jgi:hypothetical protein
MEKAARVLSFAIALEALVLFVPKDKSEVKEWARRARVFEKEHLSNGGLSPEVPHFLWHYLADADIRLKSPQYAAVQNRLISRLLDCLKQGEIPSGAELDA